MVSPKNLGFKVSTAATHQHKASTAMAQWKWSSKDCHEHLTTIKNKRRAPNQDLPNPKSGKDFQIIHPTNHDKLKLNWFHLLFEANRCGCSLSWAMTKSHETVGTLSFSGSQTQAFVHVLLQQPNFDQVSLQSSLHAVCAVDSLIYTACLPNYILVHFTRCYS